MGKFLCKKNQRIIEKKNKTREILKLFQLCHIFIASYKNKIIENEEAFLKKCI